MSEWQRGGLGVAEAETLEQHLTECSVCLAVLESQASTGILADCLAKSQSALTDITVDTAILQELKLKIKKLCDSEMAGTTGASADSVGEIVARLAPAHDAGEIGRLADYRILRVLGAGGMGVVLLAEDLQLKRRVALKIMRPSLTLCGEGRQRFLREAQAAAGLKHPHIVTIYQVGEDGGLSFLAMELLEGETLEERLRREGSLPIDDVIRIGMEIAEGLAAAHERGLIHRDIKPANIFLEGGRAKILDFGLARPLEAAEGVTTPGLIVGSPGFMSPEQANGGPIDARSDLFSLGCVLYLMTTGQKPFPGARLLESLRALETSSPASAHSVRPGTPVKLSNLIAQLMAKPLEDRPLTSLAVASSLRELKDITAGTMPSQSPSATNLTPILTDRDKTRRYWGLPLLLVAVAAVFLGILYTGQIVMRLYDEKGKEIGQLKLPDNVKSVGVQPPGGKEIKIPVGDGKKTASTPLSERQAAEWVLSQKRFDLRIRVGNDERAIGTQAELPAGVWHVVRVHWEGPSLTDELLSKLKCFPELRSLGLHVPLLDEDLRRLKDLVSLKTLDLKSGGITDAGLAQLKPLVKLESLIVQAKITDAGLAHLQALPKLENLELPGCQIRGEGLAKLASLKHLVLDDNPMDDQGMVHLKKFSKLNALSLCATPITDKGLATLKDHPQLSTLQLNGTRVSDAGLADLASLAKLHTLQIKNTRISPKGLANLRMTRPNMAVWWSEPNRTAAEAVLALKGEVRIRIKGKAEERVVKLIKDLPGDYFQVIGAAVTGAPRPGGDLMEKLCALHDPEFDRLESLDLSATETNDLDLHHLERVTSLRELVLTGPNVSDVSLGHLRSLKNLRRLDLNQMQVRGTGLTALKHISNLIELRVESPNLNDLVVPTLREMKKLERLSLAKTSLTNDGLKLLVGIASLQELDITDTKVTAAGVAAAQKMAPNCKIHSNFGLKR